MLENGEHYLPCAWTKSMGKDREHKRGRTKTELKKRKVRSSIQKESNVLKDILSTFWFYYRLGKKMGSP